MKAATATTKHISTRAVLLAFLVLLVLLPAATTAQTPPPAPPPPAATPTRQPAPRQRHTLPNGLRVWCYPRPGTNSATALLVVRSGSRNETTDTNGIAHFVEHMLFTGSQRWNETEIKQIINQRGGYWNGWTTTEYTGFYAQIAAHDTDIALEWLAEIVFHATIPADKVDNERRVILQEKGGSYDVLLSTLERLDIRYRMTESLREQLFPQSSLRFVPIGTDQSIKDINRPNLLHHYQTYYHPNNAALIVVGNINPDDIVAQARYHFGALEAATLPPPPAPPPPMPDGPHQITLRFPTATNRARVSMAARTVGHAHPDAPALDLLAYMVRKDLMEEIRYRQGMVYSIDAKNITYSDSGYFSIDTYADHSDHQTIVRTIEHHLQRIASGDLAPDSLQQARTALVGRWSIATEDNRRLAEQLAEWALILDDDEPWRDYPTRIHAVTADDLARVAQTYFQPEQRCIGMHRPIFTLTALVWVVGGIVLLLVARRTLRLLRKII